MTAVALLMRFLYVGCCRCVKSLKVCTDSGNEVETSEKEPVARKPKMTRFQEVVSFHAQHWTKDFSRAIRDVELVAWRMEIYCRELLSPGGRCNGTCGWNRKG